MNYQIVFARYGGESRKGRCQYWNKLKVILPKNFKTKENIIEMLFLGMILLKMKLKKNIYK